MDTHVTTGPVLDDSPTLRARLPGEPDDGVSAGGAVPPLHAEKHEAPSPPARKRRSGLLSGFAIIAVVVIAGGGFLVSPYDTVVPVPPAMKLAALHAEMRVVSLLGHHTVPAARALSPAPVKTASAASPSEASVPTPPTLDGAATGVVAPSAALAAAHAPAPPAAVVQPPYKPMPQNTEMAELLGLQQGGTTPSTATIAPPAGVPHPTPAPPKVQPAKSGTQTPAAPSPHQAPAAQPGTPPPGYVAREPGTVAGPTSAPAIAQATTTPPGAPPNSANAADSGHTSAGAAQDAGNTPPQAAKAASPPVAAQAGAAAPHVAPLHEVVVDPGNVLAISPKLEAAPMAPQQQIQVLEMVTQLATLIRDQRMQIVNLQADVQTSQQATAARLGDFERRLVLVEAGTALAAASGAPVPAPGAAPTTSATPTPATVALTSAKSALAAATALQAPVPSAPAPAQPSSGTQEQYRVQAASPALAMLAEVDRSGGDGAQLEVQVGDTLPGYGRVLSVSQQGTAWLVKTEHGTIQ